MDLATHPWQTYAACGGHDAEMWISPSKRSGSDVLAVLAARKAISICNTCPVREHCDEDRGVVIGMIRAGWPYDDRGKPAPACQICHRPTLSGDQRSRTCEDHTKYELMKLRAGR